MLIKLRVDKKYDKPQIHICNDEATNEIKELYRIIDMTVNTGIKAYDGDEIVMVKASNIIHIYTHDLKVYVGTADGRSEERRVGKEC